MGTSAVAIVEVETWTAAVYPPAAGTPELAADVTAGEQALANRSKWLKAKVTALWTYQNSATGVDVVRVVSAAPVAAAADWAADSATGEVLWVAQVNTNVVLRVPLPDPVPPHGTTFVQVRIRVLGAGGHVGLPGTMPRLELCKRAFGGGRVLIDSASDTSADVAAYQLEHTITLSGLVEVVDRSATEYWIELRNEFGANALAGLTFYAAEVTYTPLGGSL